MEPRLPPPQPFRHEVSPSASAATVLAQAGSRSCKELPNFLTLPSVVVWVREKIRYGSRGVFELSYGKETLLPA